MLLFAMLGLLVTSSATSAAEERSPSELIRFLTYQSDRPDKERTLLGLHSCGSTLPDLAATRSLVEFGDSAIPDLEGALSSIEKRGERSEFAFNGGWLLVAYAKIEGPAAYPRLQRMIGSPNLAFLQIDLDRAVALSLAMTSYVSGSRVPVRIFHCSRAEEPRDALDQLILAWERNDRPWLEASLGSRAKAALHSLLVGRTWKDLRTELWHGQSDHRVAMGYRFETSGPWAEPEDALNGERHHQDASLDSAFQLDAKLKNGSGTDCGRQDVKFVKRAVGTRGTLEYLVDNPDLRSLLRSVAFCAADQSE
jgi:hypothetical protein